MLSRPQGNHAWQEVENQYRGRLPIKPQTFCGLKKAKGNKDTAKKPTVCIIMRSRITDKMPLLPDKQLRRINRKLVCGWINQL